MATGTEKRSKALHNFTMPCNLRWGNQRFLRCMKVNSSDGGQISNLRRHDSGDSSDHHHRTDRDRHSERDYKDHSSADQFMNRSLKVGPPETRRRFNDDDGDVGIAAVRAKVMLDLQNAADKMKNAIFKDGLEEGEILISPSPPPHAAAPVATVEAETTRPWNLRTRRAPCRNGGGPTVGGGNDVGGSKGLRPDLGRHNLGISQTKVATAAGTSHKLPIQKSGVGGGGAASSGEKRERGKFSVPLSKSEIEEDFMAMVGHRPPRRPKKRSRTIQKQVDMVFPGFWLTEVTADMYKVVEGAP